MTYKHRPSRWRRPIEALSLGFTPCGTAELSMNKRWHLEPLCLGVLEMILTVAVSCEEYLSNGEVSALSVIPPFALYHQRMPTWRQGRSGALGFAIMSRASRPFDRSPTIRCLSFLPGPPSYPGVNDLLTCPRPVLVEEHSRVTKLREHDKHIMYPNRPLDL